jgi:hypothetical protein
MVDIGVWTRKKTEKELKEKSNENKEKEKLWLHV